MSFRPFVYNRVFSIIVTMVIRLSSFWLGGSKIQKHNRVLHVFHVLTSQRLQCRGTAELFTCFCVGGEKAAGIILVDGKFSQLTSIFYPILLQNSFIISGIWGFDFHNCTNVSFAKVAFVFLPFTYFSSFIIRTILKQSFNRGNLVWFLFLTRINLI